jgi:hypothetical protein
MYKFLTHTNEERRLWHEIFGHHNYRYFRSVKFEEGPLHAVSDQPVEDFLDETVEEGFDAHSRTSDNDDEKVFGSYS